MTRLLLECEAIVNLERRKLFMKNKQNKNNAKNCGKNCGKNCNKSSENHEYSNGNQNNE